jgi:hypothetical protein
MSSSSASTNKMVSGVSSRIASRRAALESLRARHPELFTIIVDPNSIAAKYLLHLGVDVTNDTDLVGVLLRPHIDAIKPTSATMPAMNAMIDDVIAKLDLDKNQINQRLYPPTDPRRRSWEVPDISIPNGAIIYLNKIVGTCLDLPTLTQTRGASSSSSSGGGGGSRYPVVSSVSAPSSSSSASGGGGGRRYPVVSSASAPSSSSSDSRYPVVSSVSAPSSSSAMYVPPKPVNRNNVPPKPVNRNSARIRDALITAVEDNHINDVAVLLEEGANANTRNSAGVTVLSIAQQLGYPEIIRLLQEHGAQDTPNASSSSSAEGGGSMRRRKLSQRRRKTSRRTRRQH